MSGTAVADKKRKLHEVPAATSKVPAVISKVVDIQVIKITVMEGYHCREKVNGLRVQELADYRKNGGEFKDPVRVMPIPGSNGEYYLTDGWERYLADVQAGSVTIRAIIDTDFHSSTDPSSIDDIKKEILFKSLQCNFNHQEYPLTAAEKRDAVRKLYKNGWKKEALFIFGGETSVFNWIGDIIRSEKHEIRQRCIARVNDGEKQSVVAKSEKQPKQTVNDWVISERERNALCECPKNSELKKPDASNNENGGTTPSGENQGLPHKESEVSHDNSVPPGNGNSAPKNGGTGEPDEELGPISKIYEMIRQLKPSSKMESEVKNVLLPAIATRFTGLTDYIGSHGYVQENKQLEADYQARITQCNISLKKIDELKCEISELKSELASRREHCHFQCHHSREQYMKWQEDGLTAMLEDIEVQMLFMKAVDSAWERLASGAGPEGVGQLLEKVTDLADTYRPKKIFLPMLRNISADFKPIFIETRDALRAQPVKADKYLNLGVAAGKSIVKRGAIRDCFRFLSYIEYCKELKHDRTYLYGMLIKFDDLIVGTEVDGDVRATVEDIKKALKGGGNGKS